MKMIYSDTEGSLELESLSDMTFDHLEEVKLVNFIGRMSEMLFIKLLLANSPVLERMLIDQKFLYQELLDKRLEFFTEISNFSCASLKAKCVYVDLRLSQSFA